MKSLITFLFIVLTNCLSAQSKKDLDPEAVRLIIEERIDFLSAEQKDARADYQDVFQQLEYYFYHPLNLNNAKEDDLRGMGLLNELQINELLDHRTRHGNLLAIEELQSLQTFNLNSIKMIRPFCMVSKEELFQPSIGSIKQEGRSQLLLRSASLLEKRVPNNYLGPMWNLYARYRFQYYQRLSIGLTAEKDAGEAFFKKEQKTGFDFYSAHFFARDLGKIKQLALGDYHVQFGQGLTFWTGNAMANGLGIGSLKRNARGILPYTSVQEDRFLRGVALCTQLENFQISTFLSQNKIDGNLIYDPNSESQKISSFYGSGLHRNKSELEKKDQISERIMGANLQYKKKSLHIGLTSAFRAFNYKIAPNERLYRKFDQSHHRQINAGIDYNFHLKNSILFGEIGRSWNNAFAYLNGILWVPNKRLSLGALYRRYDERFSTIHSNALSVSSRTSNEESIVLQLEVLLSRNISLRSSSSFHKFNWLRYRVNGPSKEMERSVQLDYQISKNLLVYIRSREQHRAKNSDMDTRVMKGLNNEITRSYRIHLSYQLNELVRIQSRLEWKYIKSQENLEKGMLAYQDLNIKLKELPLNLTVRFSIFDTDSYLSRIYAYENDLLYSFSILPNYGVGSKYYLLVKWKLKKGFDLWIRFDRISYLDRDSIGSVMDEILDNKRSQIKSQLRFTF